MTIQRNCRATTIIAFCGAVASAGVASAATPFTLTSPAFEDGAIWPSKYAGALPNAPGQCPGENVSPPLVWSNAPGGTKSFAILMFDPDGGNGLGSSHWVAYGIAANKTSLAEGEASVAPTAWTAGVGSRTTVVYFGPCGPANHALHHYHINVIATDFEPGSLKPGMTRDELLKALAGHALATAGIVGRYTRPSP